MLNEEINKNRNKKGQRKIQLNRGKLSGLQFYGLTEQWIITKIEELPNAFKCKNYLFQFVNPNKLQLKSLTMQEENIVEEELPENKSGCARTEIYNRKSKNRKHIDAEGTYRNLLMRNNRKMIEQTANNNNMLRFESGLPDAMKYRQFKAKPIKLILVKSKIHEYGVVACENIEENEMIIEYIGEIISKNVADKREKVCSIYIYIKFIIIIII